MTLAKENVLAWCWPLCSCIELALRGIVGIVGIMNSHYGGNVHKMGVVNYETRRAQELKGDDVLVSLWIWSIGS